MWGGRSDGQGLIEGLPEHIKQLIDIEKTMEEKYQTFLHKLPIVLRDGAGRDAPHKVKKQVSTQLAMEQHYINGVQCWCSVQASPERRPLLRQGALWYQAMRTAKVGWGDYKVEYQGQTIKVLSAGGSVRPVLLGTHNEQKGGWNIEAEGWRSTCTGVGHSTSEALYRLLAAAE